MESEKKSILPKMGKQPYGTWSPHSTFHYITLAVFVGGNDNDVNRGFLRRKWLMETRQQM